MGIFTLFSKPSKRGSHKKSPHDAIAVIGLGNPGDQYEHSPHNAGFLVVDQIAQHYGHNITKLMMPFGGKLLQIKPESEGPSKKLVLLKPQKFMNKSGESVAKFLQYYNFSLTDDKDTNRVYVIHDDLDLNIGKHKITFGKSGKSHNGVTSINQHLGTTNYWRIRVGAMPPHKPKNPAAYLTHRIPKDYQPDFDQSITQTAQAFLDLLS